MKIDLNILLKVAALIFIQTSYSYHTPPNQYDAVCWFGGHTNSLPATHHTNDDMSLDMCARFKTSFILNSQ